MRLRTALCAALLLATGAAPQPPTVRRLNVLVVLYTRSFSRALTPAQVERVHEEVAEFYDFYQSRGSAKVDFDFSLVQIDRELRRDEVEEVAPGRYYLSRENVERDLLERVGGAGAPKVDEVIALYAWSNANPADAQLAYGGGAVGPDGRFFGDAGFNSIGVFAWDIDRVGQILIHEVLHNLDDMFARSGMPDDFFNSDEMSRNMPRLVAEKPGAFLPRFADREMLAYAERERAGKESYPWAMQLVYYGWMLERTPKRAWDALKYGEAAEPRGRGAAAPLDPHYRTIWLAAANDSAYLPVLRARGASATAGGACVPLAPRHYTQVDFDGAAIYSGAFLGAWVPLAPAPLAAPIPPLRIGLAQRCGAEPRESVTVVRQRRAWVEAAERIERPLHSGDSILVRLIDERLGEPVATRASHAPVRVRATVDGRPVAGRESPGELRIDPRSLPAGRSTLVLGADGLGTAVHDIRVPVERAPSWAIVAARPPVGPMMGPLNVTVDVRERSPVRATVRASVRGRTVPMTEVGAGRYTVNVDSLPPGLHEVVVTAERGDGVRDVDTLRVWSEPRGYLRVPDSLAGAAGGTARLPVRVRTRGGDYARGLGLPLVAVAGGRAIPLAEDSSGIYSGPIPLGPGQGRATVVSLLGSFPRRVVMLRGAGSARAPAAALATRAGAMDLVSASRASIAIDGRFDDWTPVAPLRLDAASLALLTPPADYSGSADLAARVRFAWDDSTFHVFADVDDDSATAGEAWDVDRINLVFDANADDTPLTYRAASPPVGEWQEDDYWVFIRPFGQGARGTVHREGSRGSGPVAGARVAAVRRPGGYTVEAAIPMRELPRLGAFVGSVSGFNLFFTDGDGRGAASELMWHGRWPFGSGGLSWHLADMGRLVLVDEPPRP